MTLTAEPATDTSTETPPRKPERHGEPLVNLSGIVKSFPGVQALRGVDLDIQPGEIHGLVGKNGAGKSTLVRILMGLYPPDEGTIEIAGEPRETMTSNDALAAGIAYVPQHIALMESLTVAENILAGSLPKNALGMVNWSRVYGEADERLRKLKLPLDVRKRVEGLSVAEQTMLAIAKALFGNARLIILDEPTASLPRADIDRLFGFVKSLQNDGVSFVYISHHLEEVFEICDRVTILRDGQWVGTFPVTDLDMAALTRHIVGEDVKEYQRDSAATSETVLQLNALTRRGHYEDIDITLTRGEVIGVSGLQGSGAEALARGLFGMDHRGIGEALLNGKPFMAFHPREALAQGLAYLPQDRTRLGLVGVRPVRENVTYTVLEQLSRSLLGLVQPRQEREMVSQYIDDLDIKTPGQEQAARLLSGGNQQKVVFAKLAATKPSVLLLHEPTLGVDVRAKQDIYRIIDQLSQQGVGIIVISSEVRELMGVCDRILVMYRGRIIREFVKDAPETTPENILLAVEGGDNDNAD